MALVLANGTTRPDTPTLHRADGSKFSGDVAVQAMLPDYTRHTPEIVMLADGTRAFTQIGDAVGWFDSFRLDAYDKAAVRQIKNNIGAESNAGLFVLHVPDLAGSGNEEFLIRFFDAPFGPQTPRRKDFPQLFSADVTEIEILGYEDNR